MQIEALFAKILALHRGAENRLHQDTARAEVLFQTAPITALLEGVYDGDTTFADLAQHGDFGLGTFNALDGEMAAFDGRFYQITSDGRVHPVDPATRTPFAVVTFFDHDIQVDLDDPLDFEGLRARLDQAVTTPNVFYAVRIDGSFSYLKARSVPRQTPPYRPLVEVVEDQPTYEFHDLAGTLVGFRFPDYTAGINVPGYHLHFVSADRTVGGHLLECRTDRVRVAFDYTSNLRLELPGSAAFERADLAKDTRNAIRQVEQ